MKQPHFIKYGKRQAATGSQSTGPQPTASTAGEPASESGEVVIRADAIFLGSSYPRRLRVVCFESPAIGLGRIPGR
jgi:hypothetical protein